MFFTSPIALAATSKAQLSTFGSTQRRRKTSLRCCLVKLSLHATVGMIQDSTRTILAHTWEVVFLPLHLASHAEPLPSLSYPSWLTTAFFLISIFHSSQTNLTSYRIARCRYWTNDNNSKSKVCRGFMIQATSATCSLIDSRVLYLAKEILGE